jgi:hypothetical protein
MNPLSNLCTPAMIYFVISFIYLIISVFANFNIISIIFKIFFIMAWSLVLNFLCSSGFTIIAWLILLLPFFMF